MLPKPLVKVGGRALIDHCLDRLAENGVERAIVNVHWLADQIEAHLARAPVAEDHHLRRARQAARSGRRHQARPAARSATIRSFSATPTPSGSKARARTSRASPRRSTREAMDVAASGCGRSAAAVGVDWPGDFTMTREGRLAAREPRHVAPFVYTGRRHHQAAAVRGRGCRTSSASRRSFTPRPPRAGSSAFGSTACGCMSDGRKRSPRRRSPIERSIL